MIHEFSDRQGNWHMKLADLIEIVEAGDTIIVRDETIKELAEGAVERMRPDENIKVDLLRSTGLDLGGQP